jgi:G3E family GTPase
MAENDTQIGDLTERLRVLNPAAPIIASRTEDVDPTDLFGTGLFDPTSKTVDFENWLQVDAYADQPDMDLGGESSAELDEAALAYYSEHGHTPEDHHHHDQSIKSFVFVRDEPVSLNMLSMFLEGMTKEAGPDLLRVKGIVHVAERPDQPAVIQGAQQIIHSLDWMDQWPSDDRRTRIVFITRNIDQDYIEDTFDLIARISARTEAAAIAAR